MSEEKLDGADATHTVSLNHLQANGCVSHPEFLF